MKKNLKKEFNAILIATSIILFLSINLVIYLASKGMFTYGLIIDFNLDIMLSDFFIYLFFNVVGIFVNVYLLARAIKRIKEQGLNTYLIFLIKYLRNDLILGNVLLVVLLIIAKVVPIISFILVPVLIAIMIPYNFFYFAVKLIIKHNRI